MRAAAVIVHPSSNHLGAVSGDAKRCSLPGAGMGLHDDLDVLSQRDEKAQEPLHGKLPEVAMQELGDIGLLHAEKLRGLDLLQAALLQQRVDFADELRLEELLLGGSLRRMLRVRHWQVPGIIASGLAQRAERRFGYSDLTIASSAGLGASIATSFAGEA
jgi:hypothetical protein